MFYFVVWLLGGAVAGGLKSAFNLSDGACLLSVFVFYGLVWLGKTYLIKQVEAQEKATAEEVRNAQLRKQQLDLLLNNKQETWDELEDKYKD